MGKGAYVKGARFERALKARLVEAGFYVVRSSKSGVDGVSPDLLALRSTKKFALECKAVNAPTLYIEKPKMQVYREWERTTGLPVYVAWKIDRGGWRFFPLAALRETPQAYKLDQSDLRSGLTFDEIVA